MADDGFLKPVRQGVRKARKLVEQAARARDGRAASAGKTASMLLITAAVCFSGFVAWIYLILNSLK